MARDIRNGPSGPDKFDKFWLEWPGFKNGLTGDKIHCYKRFRSLAGVAQLVEQLIRNQQVRGSSPRAGSTCLLGGLPSEGTHSAIRGLFNPLAPFCLI
jgi:hypothetical protein